MLCHTLLISLCYNDVFAYSPRTQATRFAICMIAFRLSDVIINYILIDGVGVSYIISPLIVAGILFFAKFFVYQKFVFTTAQK